MILEQITTFKSSSVQQARWNEQERELEITFMSGTVYKYTAVMVINYLNFIRDAALSAGSSFTNHIRDNYTGTKVEEVSDVK
jgi:hypothetical protein